MQRFGADAALIGDVLEERHAGRSALWLWRQIELRAEVFNVAHTTHLGPPNLLIDQPALAGRITSTQSPARQVQLGVRVVF
jgi:hypothetical protein